MSSKESIEYVLVAGTQGEVQAEVNRRLAEGWDLHGSHTTALCDLNDGFGPNIYVTQAMIRYTVDGKVVK
jgi:hypothetical protein